MNSVHDLPARYAGIVKAQARELGFDFCGIAKADFLAEEAPRLEAWLKAGHHGQMRYMEDHFDKRLDPRLLVPGARSVISLMYNYWPEKKVLPPESYQIAKYAYGEDYHFVIKDLLKTLFGRLQAQIGQFEGRVFVDSAPVMERQWAAKAGLGWTGKNTLLIHPKAGSFFFLAEIICDLELAPDGPIRDYCGTCTRCIDACPTEAITPYHVDASRCISYLTIELREEIPDHLQGGQMKDWIFGCDICQDVCPWNRFSTPHRQPAFAPHPLMHRMDRQAWEEMTEETFRTIFKHSAVKRTKYEGLRRNIRAARRP